MDETSTPPQSGSSFSLLGWFRRLAETLVGTLHNRIELFAVELQEEKAWLISTLLWAAAAVFFCGLTILFIVGTIVWLTPEPARGWILGGFAVIFVFVAVQSVKGLRRSLRDKPRPLAETLGELKKDLEWIRSQD
jgi:uncharacterized membrane protein YqjE